MNIRSKGKPALARCLWNERGHWGCRGHGALARLLDHSHGLNIYGESEPLREKKRAGASPFSKTDNQKAAD